MSDDLRYIPTAADLFAAATVIEKRCSEQNIAFMECKTTCEHPKECLAQAHTVQECVMDTQAVVSKLDNQSEGCKRKVSYGVQRFLYLP